MGYDGGTSAVPGERVPSPSDFVLGNNLLRANDFGKTVPAPDFGGGPTAPGVIVDGGGNVCSPPAIAGYPLDCH